MLLCVREAAGGNYSPNYLGTSGVFWEGYDL